MDWDGQRGATGLVGHIRFQLKQRYHVLGVDVGPIIQVREDGHLQLKIRTHPCMEDMENFAAAHRWATTVDLTIYRDA